MGYCQSQAVAGDGQRSRSRVGRNIMQERLVR